MTTDSELEKEIQAKGLTAPRVTPDSLESIIRAEVYFTAAEGVAGSTHAGFLKAGSGLKQALGLLTFCVLYLENGFTVTGEGVCASPENFNAEVGRKAARANAISKLWPLEGYRLKQRLYEAKTAGPRGTTNIDPDPPEER